MTLDEYKKQMGERSGPKFNLRKAGEGSEIDPKWKKTYAYKKEKETHDEDEDEVSFDFEAPFRCKGLVIGLGLKSTLL